MSVQRRKFLKGAALGGVAAGAAASSSFPKPAIAQERLEWRMVTAWPKGLPGVGTGAEKLAKMITDMSGGRLTVTVYAAGELVPPLQCFDAVADGTAQLGHDASYYHLGKTKAAVFFTSYPWGFTAAELSAWVHHGGAQALWDQLYEPFGIQAFLAGNTGTQMFGWFKNEINSLADFQGLKFRTPGIQNEILNRLGANAVVLPGGEIFPALQAGTIDGAEWIGPANDLAFGLHQVCKYYYSPGYQEPGPGLQLMVSRSEFSKLPDDLKAILRQASQAAHDDMLADYNAQSGPALKTLVTEHGVQLRQLPEDILVATGNAANDIMNEMYEAGDATTKAIVDSFLEFRTNIVPWTRVGEQAYMNARLLPFTLAKKG